MDLDPVILNADPPSCYLPDDIITIANLGILLRDVSVPPNALLFLYINRGIILILDGNVRPISNRK